MVRCPILPVKLKAPSRSLHLTCLGKRIFRVRTHVRRNCCVAKLWDTIVEFPMGPSDTLFTAIETLVEGIQIIGWMFIDGRCLATLDCNWHNVRDQDSYPGVEEDVFIREKAFPGNKCYLWLCDTNVHLVFLASIPNDYPKYLKLSTSSISLSVDFLADSLSKLLLCYDDHISFRIKSLQNFMLSVTIRSITYSFSLLLAIRLVSSVQRMLLNILRPSCFPFMSYLLANIISL